MLEFRCLLSEYSNDLGEQWELQFDNITSFAWPRDNCCLPDTPDIGPHNCKHDTIYRWTSQVK